jgi:predicted nucleic acid-binding protein
VTKEKIMKKKVYIETSIVSFLTGNPSSNLLAAAWKALTIEWWEKRRMLFDLFISELVLTEAGRGNEKAAEKRLNSLDGIPMLAVTDSAVELAKMLIKKHAIPGNASDDALHVALSAVHGMDYLLTWNCRHIDNAETKPAIRAILISNGYNCPEICTPQEFMGDNLNEE